MDITLVHTLVGCILITRLNGLTQTMTYCQKKHQDGNRYLVSVCQDNTIILPSHGGIIIIDPAGAPRQQAVECKCYLSFIHGGSQQYISAYLFLEMDTNQNITFTVNGHVYETDTSQTELNITIKSMIKFRQENQKYTPLACLGLQIVQTQDNVTMRCEANRHESTTATATPTRSMPLMPNMTTPFKLHTDKEGSTDDLKVILCASIGGGMLLVAICIVVCCTARRQRRSEKNSKPNEKYMDKASSPTDSSAEGTMEHSAEYRTTQATHETGRIMTSEYVDVDHCDATARAKYDCKKSTESDVYNHLNELQPVQHSDNVYSTTHMYKTTKQESRAMPKRGAIDDPSESDVYNHLNEVRLSPHTDNIYNATNVKESGATTSQYDSVELVNRQHNVKLDTDYNVLSFP